MYLFFFTFKDGHHIYIVTAKNRRHAWRVFHDVLDVDTAEYRTITAAKKDYEMTALRIPDTGMLVGFVGPRFRRRNRMELFQNPELEILFKMTPTELEAFKEKLRST